MLAPFAKIFATGPEDPLKDRHCFYCMIRKRKISMKSRGLYELKGHFQTGQQLRADQRFRARYHPQKYVVPTASLCTDQSWKQMKIFSCIWMFLIRRTSHLFTMIRRKVSRLLLRLRVHGFQCRLSY